MSGKNRSTKTFSPLMTKFAENWSPLTKCTLYVIGHGSAMLLLLGLIERLLPSTNSIPIVWLSGTFVAYIGICGNHAKNYRQTIGRKPSFGEFLRLALIPAAALLVLSAGTNLPNWEINFVAIGLLLIVTGLIGTATGVFPLIGNEGENKDKAT